MLKASSTALPSQDFTTDVATDYFGSRLATASQDHMVRVLRRRDEGEWALEATLQGHKGPVLAVAWANPDFGQLLASCAFDRTVIIWEESTGVGSASAASSTESSWKKVAVIGERDAIVGVAFAPKHCGLRLATCSSDGWIRVYQATDLANQHWAMRESFRAGDAEDATCDASSIAWNSYPYDRPSLVVGSVDPPGAAIWRLSETRKKWKVAALLQGASPHTAGVNHVDWAVNLGRSFHLLATASSDGTAKIWKVSMAKRGQDVDEKVLGDEDALDVVCMQTLDHGCEVWRVEWNVTGTVLATSCDDGVVRLWGMGPKAQWVLQSKVDTAVSYAAVASAAN
jgi:nucleoporin SEH1